MRRGGWILTYSGRQFFPFDPRAEEVDILDIAHALSRICRFGGHVHQFYSVAQHSVFVAGLVRPELAAAALMHDAAEAYCGDLVRPIKRALPHFSLIEGGIMAAIERRFDLRPLNLSISDSAEVRRADNVALLTERRDFMAESRWPWIEDGLLEPQPSRLIALPPDDAKDQFLARWAWARLPESGMGVS